MASCNIDESPVHTSAQVSNLTAQTQILALHAPNKQVMAELCCLCGAELLQTTTIHSLSRQQLVQQLGTGQVHKDHAAPDTTSQHTRSH